MIAFSNRDAVMVAVDLLAIAGLVVWMTNASAGIKSRSLPRRTENGRTSTLRSRPFGNDS